MGFARNPEIQILLTARASYGTSVFPADAALLCLRRRRKRLQRTSRVESQAAIATAVLGTQRALRYGAALSSIFHNTSSLVADSHRPFRRRWPSLDFRPAKGERTVALVIGTEPSMRA